MNAPWNVVVCALYKDPCRQAMWYRLHVSPGILRLFVTSLTLPSHSRTKKKKMYVISTPKRPVPLEHFLYTGNSNKTSNELFLIVDANSKFLTRGYEAAVAAKKEREGKGKDAFGSKFHQATSVKEASYATC